MAGTRGRRTEKRRIDLNSGEGMMDSAGRLL
jgi:hypothetical protein